MSLFLKTYVTQNLYITSVMYSANRRRMHKQDLYSPLGHSTCFCHRNPLALSHYILLDHLSTLVSSAMKFEMELSLTQCILYCGTVTKDRE